MAERSTVRLLLGREQLGTISEKPDDEFETFRATRLDQRGGRGIGGVIIDRDRQPSTRVSTMGMIAAIHLGVGGKKLSVSL
jgi:hypothetical protein